MPRVTPVAVDGVDGGEGPGLVSELRVQIQVQPLLSRVALIKGMTPLHTTVPE